MLLKSGAKSGVCSLLLLAVIPSLLLNVGPNRGLLIHDHDDDDAHVHVIHDSTVPGHPQDLHDELVENDQDAPKDTHTDILILGSDLARPRHTTAADAPALILATPTPPWLFITSAVLPARQYSSLGMGAGPPNVSLASQTCLQILI
jgi:hypothetical protein